MFLYCKKCGMICKDTKQKSICEVCENQLFSVPSEYLTPSGLMFSSQEKREKFEELIMQGSEYDAEISSQKKRIIKENEEAKANEIAQKVGEYSNSTVKPRCPICHSLALEKISNVGKVVKVGVLGILGAGDIGKKYRCKSCGYRF